MLEVPYVKEEPLESNGNRIRNRVVIAAGQLSQVSDQLNTKDELSSSVYTNYMIQPIYSSHNSGGHDMAVTGYHYPYHHQATLHCHYPATSDHSSAALMAVSHHQHHPTVPTQALINYQQSHAKTEQLDVASGIQSFISGIQNAASGIRSVISGVQNIVPGIQNNTFVAASEHSASPKIEPHGVGDCSAIRTSVPSRRSSSKTSHQSGKLFSCTFCSHQTQRKDSLRKHMKTHDPSRPKPHSCSFCPYETDLKNSLLKHLVKHKSNRPKPYCCPHCTHQTDRKDSLDKHILTHMPDRNKPHTCPICGHQTDRRYSLTKHLLHHQTDRPRPFACPQCPHTTDRKESLAKHIATHQPDRHKQFACADCSYRSDRKASLEKHVLVHASPLLKKPLACSYCQFRTNRKDSLRKHALTHTRNNNRVSDTYTRSNNQNNGVSDANLDNYNGISDTIKNSDHQNNEEQLNCGVIIDTAAVFQVHHRNGNNNIIGNNTTINCQQRSGNMSIAEKIAMDTQPQGQLHRDSNIVTNNSTKENSAIVTNEERVLKIYGILQC